MGIGFLSSFEGPREECGQDGSPGCRGISLSISGDTFGLKTHAEGVLPGLCHLDSFLPGWVLPAVVLLGHGRTDTGKRDPHSCGHQRAGLWPEKHQHFAHLVWLQLQPPLPACSPPAEKFQLQGVSSAQLSRNPQAGCSDLKAAKSFQKFIFLLNTWMRSLKFRQVV